MKDLYNTLCTKSNLKLLLGEDIHFGFPLKYPKDKDPKKAKLVKPVMLSEVINQTPNLRARSHDPRFDKKHPIELAVEQIYNNGLTKSVVYKILHNKASIKAGRVLGAYKYLANFLSDSGRADVKAKLSEVSIDDKGIIVRNGKIF